MSSNAHERRSPVYRNAPRFSTSGKTARPLRAAVLLIHTLNALALPASLILICGAVWQHFARWERSQGDRR